MDNIRHSRDILSRSIYVFLIFGIYIVLLEKVTLEFNIGTCFIFFLIITGEYLFDNLNFRNLKVFLNSSLYTFLINGILFLMGWSLSKNTHMFFPFFCLTLFQILVKIILISIFIRKKKVLLIGNEKELTMVEDILENNIYIELLREKNIENLIEITKEKEIDEVIIFQFPYELSLEEKIIKLKIEGIKFTDYLSFMEKYEGKIAIKKIDNSWVIKSEGFNIFFNDFQKRIKRLFDISAAIIVILPSIPLVIIAYIVTKIQMPKVSAFYSQERIGTGGKPFKMYKFRSMKPHEPNLSLEEKAEYVTSFGNFMRKTRIDELPQIINVLKGEISFVGPRAEWDRLHEEYALNIPYYYLRQTVKPGLTGWAQVMHTHGEGVEHSLEKFEYDLYYIKYQNFMLDIIIFFKTVKTVLFGKGK